MNYQPIIGLEIHAELKTESKMFCSCPNNPAQKRPNVNICPVCMGHPGVLPVINREAVKMVVKTGLALNCEIPECSAFDRKNYFYPDLPKGYQISQYYMPLCREGFLTVGKRKIRIKEIHLEEDAGKLAHSEKEYSLVDFNRAGVPLMELATEPDIREAQEAKQFAREFQLILRYLGVSEADMEKGQLRIEVNISLRPKGSSSQKLGTKVEIKNLNSFYAAEKAVEYEIKRQSEILNSGRKVIQETRGWNERQEITLSQREKEETHNYRYFPEPDLPSISWSSEQIRTIGLGIPELPEQKRERFKNEYEIKGNEVEIFVQDRCLGNYFEKTMSELRNWLKELDAKEAVEREEFLKLAKLASNYIITDLRGLLKTMSVDDESFLITPENFGEFIALLYKNGISSKIAKIILTEMFSTGADPSHIIKEKELTQISGEEAIEKMAQEVLSRNEKAVEDFKKGKENALQFLVGQLMSVAKGRANPEMANKILRKLLEKL